MKRNTLTVVVTALPCILLFFISLTFSGELVDLLLPKMEHVEYQVTDVSGTFWSVFFISLLFGLLPIIILLVWRAAGGTTPGKKAGVAFTVVGCGLLALFARHIILVIKFNNIHSPFPEVNISYPDTDLNFGAYLLGGLIIGSAAALFMFRKTKSASRFL